MGLEFGAMALNSDKRDASPPTRRIQTRSSRIAGTCRASVSAIILKPSIVNYSSSFTLTFDLTLSYSPVSSRSHCALFCHISGKSKGKYVISVQRLVAKLIGSFNYSS